MKKLTTTKEELYNRIDDYFKNSENSWLCLNDFIKEECPKEYYENEGWVKGVANYLQNTSKYICTVQPTTGLYEIKPNPSYELSWYNTTNAKRQYDDYPQLKKRATIAFWLSILSIVLAVVTLLLKIQCNTPNQPHP